MQHELDPREVLPAQSIQWHVLDQQHTFSLAIRPRQSHKEGLLLSRAEGFFHCGDRMLVQCFDCQGSLIKDQTLGQRRRRMHAAELFQVWTLDLIKRRGRDLAVVMEQLEQGGNETPLR